MIFYDGKFKAYSTEKGIIPPLSEINDIDMDETLIRDQAYLDTCLSKKIIGISKCTGKLNYCAMNVKVISKMLLANLPQYDYLVNYGGYGIAENGDFYFDYNDLSAKDFDVTSSKNHADDRRIVGKIDTKGELQLTIVEGTDRSPFVLKTASTQKGVMAHSAAALIYGIIAMIITKMEYHYITVSDDGYQVGLTLFNHFIDICGALNSGGSEANVIKATRCLDNDIYSLFTYPGAIKDVYDTLPISVRKYEKDRYPMMDLDSIPKLKVVYGSSCYLDGSRAIDNQGNMTKDDEPMFTVEELLKNKNQFYLNPERVLTVEEQALIPNKSEMVPNKEVLQKIELIKKSTSFPRPFRNLLWTGETGSGKSTACQMAAQLLGIPYVFVTINPDTLLTDLYANFLPQTDKGLSKKEISAIAENYPDFDEISINPELAYAKITGTSKKDATEKDCIQAMLSDISNKITESGDFVCIKSDLVKAVENGWFVEIQEANLASKPGVLGGINALMDDLGTIVLPTGEVIHRHPDCVIALTANVDYEGTRRLNQAVMSRLALKGVFTLPTDNSLIQIIKQDSGYENDRNIQDMVKVMYSIRKVLEDNGETSGSCGLREIVNWAQAVAVTSDDRIFEMAEATIIPSATTDPEIRVLVEQAVETQFARI